MRNLVFIADAHIHNDSQDVLIFHDFLKSIKSSTKILCVLGDLFNIWLAKKRLEQYYQSEILDQFRELKMLGLKLVYIEGNRDFHVKRTYLGDPFDEVCEEARIENFDGRNFYIHHGDNINTQDRSYRLWKAFSKSRSVWSLFNVLPLNVKMMVAGNLEKTLKKTNIKHKSCFPQEQCEEFGEKILKKNFDVAIIGHLHQEKILEFDIDGQKKCLYSLPAWKLEKRYLLFEPGREGKFVTFSG